MENFYIFWDDESVAENERRVYIQCVECHKKNGKGVPWSIRLLTEGMEVKCELCHTIIYTTNEEGDNEASI